MEMLSAEQAYLFRHAAVREAAYQLQLPAERALLHELALELMQSLPALATRAHALELAYHARHAAQEVGDGQRAAYLRACEIKHLEAGIEYARANFDYSAAMEALNRLLTLHADDREQLAAAHDSMADVLERQGRWPEAMKHFEQVLLLHPHPEWRGRAMIHLSWYGLETGDREAAVAHLKQCEQLAEQADSSKLRIASLMVHARRLHLAGQPDVALQNEQMALALAHESGDWVQSLIGCMNLSSALFALRRDDQALEYALRARALAKQRPQGRNFEAQVCMAFHTAQMRARDFEAAKRHAHEARLSAIQTRNRGDLVEALAGCAQAEIGRGQYTQADALLRAAEDECREIGVATLAARVAVARVQLARLWGRHEEAQGVATLARQQWGRALPPEAWEGMEAEVWMANAAQGDVGSIERLMQRVHARPTDQKCRLDAAIASYSCGSKAEAANLLMPLRNSGWPIGDRGEPVEFIAPAIAGFLDPDAAQQARQVAARLGVARHPSPLLKSLLAAVDAS